MPRSRSLLMWISRSQIELAYRDLQRSGRDGYILSASPVSSFEDITNVDAVKAEQNQTGIDKFEALNPQLKTPEKAT